MLQTHRDPHYIDRFTIYGERHCGTNFLEACVKEQFGLDVTYRFGWKHFFGFTKPEVIMYNRQILFIGIVRNPYDWIMANIKLKHHIPPENRTSTIDFLTKEWYSIDNWTKKEIMQDRNYITKERYKNIFELRKYKIIYLSQYMPMYAANYVLMSYDSFVRNHMNFLNIIGEKFRLKTISKPPQVHINDPYFVPQDIKEIIESNIDWDLEASVGYFRKN